MKILDALICFFFFPSVQDRNTVAAQLLYTGVEGGSVTVKCEYNLPRERKFFCKEKCEEENILIETSGDRAQRGRYSIDWTGRDGFVTITQLTKSDSGQYRCGLGASVSSAPFTQLEITVVDALLHGNRDLSEDQPLYRRAGGNLTVICYFTHTGKTTFFCKGPCTDQDIFIVTNSNRDERGRYSTRYLEAPATASSYVYVTITQLTESDSGLYWCGVDTSITGFEISVTKDTATTDVADTADVPDTVRFSVGLPLVVVTMLLLSVAVLIICRKRSAKPKHEATGLKTRGNSHGKNMEIPIYENDSPVSKCKDYLSLHPATKDQNQIYYTLTQCK